jgi:hypothetical protein
MCVCLFAEIASLSSAPQFRLFWGQAWMRLWNRCLSLDLIILMFSQANLQDANCFITSIPLSLNANSMDSSAGDAELN